MNLWLKQFNQKFWSIRRPIDSTKITLTINAYCGHVKNITWSALQGTSREVSKGEFAPCYVMFSLTYSNDRNSIFWLVFNDICPTKSTWNQIRNLDFWHWTVVNYIETLNIDIPSFLLNFIGTINHLNQSRLSSPASIPPLPLTRTGLRGCTLNQLRRFQDSSPSHLRRPRHLSNW